MVKRIFNFTTESARGAIDRAALKKYWPAIKDSTPEGNGKPVLVLPGFLSSDRWTEPLQQCLKEKNYKVYGWDNGTNLGPDDKTFEHLATRLKEVYDQNGQQKVSLIGHSLGGVFGRELAREFPEMVESVITLGSPFGAKIGQVHGAVMKAYKKIKPDGQLELITDKDMERRRMTPPPVPTTAVFSKNDGIVFWRDCINPAASKAENIEVNCSHVGMVYHPLAVTVILDRLAQDANNWKAFDPKAYSAKFPAPLESSDIPSDPKWVKTANSKMLFKKG